MVNSEFLKNMVAPPFETNCPIRRTFIWHVQLMQWMFKNYIEKSEWRIIEYSMVLRVLKFGEICFKTKLYKKDSNFI